MILYVLIHFGSSYKAKEGTKRQGRNIFSNKKRAIYVCMHPLCNHVGIHKVRSLLHQYITLDVVPMT